MNMNQTTKNQLIALMLELEKKVGWYDSRIQTWMERLKYERSKRAKVLEKINHIQNQIK